MSAVADNVVAFPGPIKARVSQAPVQPLAVGDMVVMCFNATQCLWMAWPVAAVDDDGVVIAVRTAAGRAIGAERVCCRPEVYGVRAADHDEEGFAALRWKTWADPALAVMAFSVIGKDPRIPK